MRAVFLLIRGLQKRTNERGRDCWKNASAYEAWEAGGRLLLQILDRSMAHIPSSAGDRIKNGGRSSVCALRDHAIGEHEADQVVTMLDPASVPHDESRQKQAEPRSKSNEEVVKSACWDETNENRARGEPG